jgi:hypothetical protein
VTHVADEGLELPGFDLDPELTDDGFLGLVVRTPRGELRLLGRVVEAGRQLRLTEVHAGGLSANSLGVRGLLRLAQAFAERFDVDEIVIEGAARTTGARPGHVPRILRWRRRSTG